MRRNFPRWLWSVVLLAGVVPLAAQARVPGRMPAPEQQPAPAVPPAPIFHSPANIEARQIVRQAIAALGGAAYLGFHYQSGSGRIYSFDSNGTLSGPGSLFWSFYRYPDAERVELTKQRDVIYIYNGNRGWEVTYRGTEALKAKALTRYEDASRHALDLVLRNWASNPRTLLIHQGTSMSEGRQVERVDFHNADGRSVTVLFDSLTHLPVREEWRHEDPVLGGFVTESVTFGNYQVFDGVNTPLVVQRYEGERRLEQRYYQSIGYGPLADTLFLPPAPKSR